MPLMTWSQELSVGIPSIDEQHKKLVAILNRLSSAMEKGMEDYAMIGVFEDLLAYTVEHFTYEEELFAKCGYPATEAHTHKHEALKAQVLSLKARMHTGDFMLDIEALSFLKDWLGNHIMKSDKAYAPFLISAGVQ
ncbi:Hemerythrin [Gammaproteobacteria bacterium]